MEEDVDKLDVTMVSKKAKTQSNEEAGSDNIKKSEQETVIR